MAKHEYEKNKKEKMENTKIYNTQIIGVTIVPKARIAAPTPAASEISVSSIKYKHGKTLKKSMKPDKRSCKNLFIFVLIVS